MSPRAFRTMLVGPMGTKDRLELESRVLAAALKQSVELGDNAGVSLAHRQIFMLIRSAHTDQDKTAEGEADAASGSLSGEESLSKPKITTIKKRRKLPNIVWTEAEEEDKDELDSEDHTEETVEIPLSANAEAEEIQGRVLAASKEQEEKEAQEEEEEEEESEDDDKVFDAYGILGIEQVASFEQIHISFLYSIRRLLFNLKKAKRKKKKELLNILQELWIAHDVLTDPVTRTDYDFRILGLRGAPDVIIDSPDSEGQVMIGSDVPLRIGELLQCAGLLEPTELEIAADMHKAMPEMLFGAFLVKQSFITETDLDQVLMGQRLLKMGYMSVGTFQSCMKQWIQAEIPIYESAVTNGLLTVSEMERIIAQGLKDTDTEIPALLPGGQVGIRSHGRGKVQSLGTGPMINEQAVAERHLSADHAVPDWKDQLDWSAPPEEEIKEEKITRKRKRTTIDTTAYQIEGVTAVPGEQVNTGRKSLRSLMKGMHLTDEDSDDEIPALSEEAIASNALSVDPGDSDTASGDSSESSKPTIDFGIDLEEPTGEMERVPAEDQEKQESIAEQISTSDSIEAVGIAAQRRIEGEDDFVVESKAEVSLEEPKLESIDEQEEQEPEMTHAVSQSSSDNYYDEDDEAIIEIEDSLEMLASSDVETYTGLNKVSDVVETSTKLDKVPEKDVETSTSLDKVPEQEDDIGDEGRSDSSPNTGPIKFTKVSLEAGADKRDDDTAEEVKKIAAELGSPKDSDSESEEASPEETARQALRKSIEWQVMYKIKGSLADVLLSDSEEPDMPPLSPRLEDIDVIPRRISSSSEDSENEAKDTEGGGGGD